MRFLALPHKFLSLALAVAILAGASLTATTASARPEAPPRKSQQIAKLVRMLVEQRHLTGRRVDDTVSERALKSFLESLDPWKLYFYQQDVDEFMQSRHALDDMVRRGDLSFAYKVYDRYMQRLTERVDTALKWIDAEHDFTVDESMIRQREDAHYPRSQEEANERWRKRIKYDLLVKIADELETEDATAATEGIRDPAAEDVDLQEAKQKLRKRYTGLLKRWEQTTDDDLLEIYLSAITLGLDPHSNYMSPSTLDQFTIAMQLELDGIGASLTSEDGYTEVHEIVPGGAADADGRLKKGDQIVGVGEGDEGPIEDIVDMRLNDVVKLIRGERGTVVRLQVKPADNPKELLEYKITRAQIKLTNQEARGEVVEYGAKPNGQPYRVGVIDLPSFYMDMEAARKGDPNYKSCSRDVRRLLEKFKSQGIDVVVVDLRFNVGGSLPESVALSGLFIDQGPVVQVKGPGGRAQPYNDPAPNMVWSGPLVVMTNSLSASASEIFAGAIQDYGRGLVIGDQSTFGKGTVQQLMDLADELFRPTFKENWGALKITIQQFYRPDGDSTQNRGVVSDVVIPALTGHLEDAGEKHLDFAVPFDRVEKRAHDEFGMVVPALVAEIQARSRERIQSSPDFAKDLRRIGLYEKQRSEKTVTLNLEEYLAEREELDTEKEQEKVQEEMSDSNRPVFDMDDHYNQEALEIVVDYLQLLKERKVAVAR